MCVEGLNAFKLLTVNSPVRAVAKKVVVRHAKTAALMGSDKGSWLRSFVKMSMVYGSRGGVWRTLERGVLQL